MGRLRELCWTARDALPTGRTLPDDHWARRHRALLWLLWFHAIAVPVYGLLRGYPLLHSAGHALPLVAFGWLAARTDAGRRIRAGSLSLGLLTAAALVVHSSGGLIEAHFHFFVLVVALTLYEDWMPFLVAVGYVVLHHGILGAIDRAAVYDHPGSPWMWAAVHGGFVLAAGVAAIGSWRLNEDVRTMAGEVEERFMSAFDDATIGMAVTSLDGTFVQVNRALCELTGYRADELVSKQFRDITHPDDVERSLAALEAMRSGDIRRHVSEKRYLHADGHEVWISLSASTVHGPAGPKYFIAQVQDITERRTAEEKLAFQAMHDTVTGLPNRALFVDRLEVALNRLERRPWPLAVMFVDLDRFKLVNDSLGHAAGDAVLQEVANRLRGAVRTSDTVARFAGDEFTVLCEDIVDESEATMLAGRIAECLRQPLVVQEHELFISASIGIVVASGGDQDVEEVLHQADAAMYQAKELAASRYAVFRDGMRPGVGDRLQLESELRRSLEREELRVHYQPEVCLTTGNVVGFEALLRWQHPFRGLLTPDAFIPAAEETGLIVPIGNWVLDEACAQTAAWHESLGLGDDARVAVNVSARQLSEPGLAQQVQDALARSGLRADQLCLEVTESAVLDGAEAALATLVALKELGVQIAIDDFGVGFSSLARIKELPPIDVVKIDRSFVSGLADNRRDAAIVSSVVNLADSLGMSALAEGVETTEQVTLLRGLGCHFAQGFHFSHPRPANEIASFAGGLAVGRAA